MGRNGRVRVVVFLHQRTGDPTGANDRGRHVDGVRDRDARRSGVRRQSAGAVRGSLGDSTVGSAEVDCWDWGLGDWGLGDWNGVLTLVAQALQSALRNYS